MSDSKYLNLIVCGRSLLFSSTFLLLIGCNLSPCCRAEPLEAPAEALHSASDQVLTDEDSVFTLSDWITADWWTIYDDPQLGELIEIAINQNPTLQAAQQKIYQAQFEADKVRSTLYPNVTWTGDAKRYKLSKTSIIPPTITIPGFPTFNAGFPFNFTLWESSLNLTYDFDVWGKRCHALKAAIGEVQSQAAEEAFARLSLSTSVAQVYFQLQISYERLQIEKEIVAVLEEYYELVQQRVNLNLDDIITLNNVQSQISNEKQTLLQIEADTAVYEHQLKAYLAGNFDEEFSNMLIAKKPIPEVPLPRELPLHLLSHRPDIVSQLWLIDSMSNQIEVAKASFYPDINLSGLAGYQTIHLHEFFYWASGNANIGPAFSLPIFDGGYLRANLRGSEADYDLAVLEYNQLVLDATREVLDALTNVRYANRQMEEFKKELSNQNDILDLTTDRENKGISSGLDVLSSQQNFLSARSNEVLAQEKTLLAILSLIKALGGGYEFIDCQEDM